MDRSKRFSGLAPFLLTLLVCLGAARTVVAQAGAGGDGKALARQRFQEATQAYQEGRFAAAASLFEAADSLAPHASTRFNAAAAWEKAGEEARAATAYEAARSAAELDEARHASAAAGVDRLSPRLGRIRILTPPGALVSVDHVHRAPVPLTFFLRPGQYTVAVEYRGQPSEVTTQLTAGKSIDLDVDLERQLEEPTPPTPRASEPAAAIASPRSVPSPPTDTHTVTRTLGWTGVGVGLALSGVAAVLGSRFLSRLDDYRETGRTDATMRREARNLKIATNLTWGGAAVFGIPGTVLLLTSPAVEF